MATAVKPKAGKNSAAYNRGKRLGQLVARGKGNSAMAQALRGPAGKKARKAGSSGKSRSSGS